MSSIKSKLIEKIKRVPFFLFYYYEMKGRSRMFIHPELNDVQFIEMLYKKILGRSIDWKNHKRFSEKSQILKLYYGEQKKIGELVDKYLVRSHIEKMGYGNTLNELLGIWYDANDINIYELPDQFVLKATHGSNWNLICKNKKEFKKHWNLYKRMMNSWLKMDFSMQGRENFYKFCKPAIVCEKFIKDYSGALTDYKFFCFNGEVKFIQVDVDRYGDWRKNFYNENWELFDLITSKPHFSTDKYKPKNLETMLEMARKLSVDFPFVRVDLYEVDDKIVFGELTFCDGSGFDSFNPDDYDFIMGDWLEFPKEVDDYLANKILH